MKSVCELDFCTYRSLSIKTVNIYFSLVHHIEVSRQLDLVSDSILHATEDLGFSCSVAWPFSRCCPYIAYPHYVCVSPI